MTAGEQAKSPAEIAAEPGVGPLPAPEWVQEKVRAELLAAAKALNGVPRDQWTPTELAAGRLVPHGDHYDCVIEINVLLHEVLTPGPSPSGPPGDL